MFIRHKNMPNGRPKVQIVKSVRTDTKVQQRVGTAWDDNERKVFDGLARAFMTDLHKETNGQHTLFNRDEYADLVDRSRHAATLFPTMSHSHHAARKESVYS